VVAAPVLPQHGCVHPPQLRGIQLRFVGSSPGAESEGAHHGPRRRDAAGDFPGSSDYGSSKAAQLGFLRTAAIELARDGVTVNAALPATVSTEGAADMGDDYVHAMVATVSLGRLRSVEDVGKACLFLDTDEADYISGQTIIIDGARHCPRTGGVAWDVGSATGCSTSRAKSG
jgi:3-oxoacyl-[acyl-carrier protein] reductase